MRENGWTDDGVALLQKLWAEGVTAADIGSRLGGLSRSAVLGKVFRLRLNGEAGTAEIPVAPERTARASAAPVRRRSRQPRKHMAKTPAKMAGRVTLLDLDNESCRWPSARHGRIFFCGAGEADLARGIPYCPHHMRRAYSGSVSFGKTERGHFTHGVKPSSVGIRA